MTRNSVRLKFVKKTSLSNPVKNLGYIKCYSSGSPKLVKSPRNFLKFRFTPCKAEQPLQGMELQEKEAQKD